MKKIALFCSAYLLASVASAATWVDADVLSIKSFETQSSHFVELSSFNNPDNCDAASRTVVIFKDDSTNWKMMHSNLLAGFLAGKRMQIRVNGCSASGHAKIDGVSILK